MRVPKGQSLCRLSDCAQCRLNYLARWVRAAELAVQTDTLFSKLKQGEWNMPDLDGCLRKENITARSVMQRIVDSSRSFLEALRALNAAAVADTSSRDTSSTPNTSSTPHQLVSPRIPTSATPQETRETAFHLAFHSFATDSSSAAHSNAHSSAYSTNGSASEKLGPRTSSGWHSLPDPPSPLSRRTSEELSHSSAAGGGGGGGSACTPWGDPVGPSPSAFSPQSLQSLRSSLLQWQSPESSGLNFQSLTRLSSSQSDACGSTMDTPCASMPMRLPALQGPHTIADLIEEHTFQILTRIVRARCPKPVVTSEVQASADMLQEPFDECVEIFRMGKDLLEQWDSRYQVYASTRLPLPPPPPPPPPCTSLSGTTTHTPVGSIAPAAATVPATDTFKTQTDTYQTPKISPAGSGSAGGGGAHGEKRGRSFRTSHSRSSSVTESSIADAQRLAGVRGASGGTTGVGERGVGGEWGSAQNGVTKGKPEYVVAMRSALEELLMACFDLCRGAKENLQAQVGSQDPADGGRSGVEGGGTRMVTHSLENVVTHRDLCKDIQEACVRLQTVEARFLVEGLASFKNPQAC
jgi:hypothetical protein